MEEISLTSHQVLSKSKSYFRTHGNVQISKKCPLGLSLLAAGPKILWYLACYWWHLHFLVLEQGQSNNKGPKPPESQNTAPSQGLKESERQLLSSRNLYPEHCSYIPWQYLQIVKMHTWRQWNCLFAQFPTILYCFVNSFHTQRTVWHFFLIQPLCMFFTVTPCSYCACCVCVNRVGFYYKILSSQTVHRGTLPSWFFCITENYIIVDDIINRLLFAWT